MIKQILIVSLAVFLIFILFIYVWQRHFIYFPLRTEPRRTDFQAENMTAVILQTEDGLRLNAWYQAAAHDNPTIIYFHGNAGHIGYRIFMAKKFMAAGLGIFLLEYRGYGGNPGSPSEQGLYADARAAIAYLHQAGVPNNKMVFYGESLGTGVAVQMAVEYNSCAVILQSPFTSLAALARYHYPWMWLKPWDRFDSISRIQQIRTPLLLLHGKQDLIVPYWHANKLFEHASEPKKIQLYEGRGHNDLWTHPDFPTGIIQFIDMYC